MKITIKDVAREANVSIATVSRVLNGTGKVNKKTKEQVLKAVKKLGYKTSTIPLAQDLKIIGILVPDLFAYHYSEIIEGATETLRKNGYGSIIATFNGRILEEEVAIEYFFTRRVYGVIVCTSEEDDEKLRRLLDIAIPVVTVDRENTDFRFDSVNIDNYLGGKMVAKYLLSKGHKKFLHITGDIDLYSIRYRRDGFKYQIEKSGGRVNVLESSFTTGTTYKKLKEYIRKNGVDFTAIFTSDDLIALETLKVLYDEGIKVPDDVSVMGFDDGYMAQFSIPPLTTVKQPRKEMGKMAARLLIDRLNPEKRNSVVRKMMMSLEIVERESVKNIER
ncbi:transcriptional regulator [Marinitoga piezophila KA3]|uniref:Transcriptional regulator n=1 Tax=Marinitoga piezophila (strain DSM 14283 / JCM 11233 / KA3) TaxID=443254 RepID=H2J7V2_MARPK|nr:MULTISPECIES: LacI family DNA-binding transcriptional regulator [Marinitoga]AEX85443.1 transcriptional regulator [Marinitoga piezophila KA3]